MQVEDSKAHATKLLLAGYVRRIIDSQNLSQSTAGRLANEQQGRISELVNGNVTHFSVFRVMRVLAALGWDVEIAVRPKREQKGRIRVAPLEWK